MHLMNTLKFLISAVALVSGAIFFQQQAVLQQEEFEMLHQHIEELTQSYENQIEGLTELYDNTVQELKETNEENLELNHELNDTLQRVESVEKRNQYLEQILFNQQQTYRNAVAMNGSTMRVLSTSSFTARQYERAWSRLRASGLTGTGQALVRSEEIYGVNSLVLASIAYHESAGGMSLIAREKNNLFGLGAFDHDPYRYALSFPTKNDSIYYAANLLSSSYLNRWGRNYRGDNLKAIGIRYATDSLWADKVCRRMSLIARAAIPEGR